MDTEKKETKEINKLSLLIMAVVVLILIIAGAGYYIYQQKQQMNDLVEAYDLDKQTLEDEFNELSMQYEGYQFNVGNDSLMNLLSTEQAKVQRLMEELRTVKATNTKEIARLKKELETLRKIMRNYVVQIDSLNRANEQLQVEKERSCSEIPACHITSCYPKERKRKVGRTRYYCKPPGCYRYHGYSGQFAWKAGKEDQTYGTFRSRFPHRQEYYRPVGEKTVYVRIMKPDDDVLVKSRADVFPSKERISTTR